MLRSALPPSWRASSRAVPRFVRPQSTVPAVAAPPPTLGELGELLEAIAESAESRRGKGRRVLVKRRRVRVGKGRHQHQAMMMSCLQDIRASIHGMEQRLHRTEVIQARARALRRGVFVLLSCGAVAYALAVLYDDDDGFDNLTPSDLYDRMVFSLQQCLSTPTTPAPSSDAQQLAASSAVSDEKVAVMKQEMSELSSRVQALEQTHTAPASTPSPSPPTRARRWGNLHTFHFQGKHWLHMRHPECPPSPESMSPTVPPLMTKDVSASLSPGTSRSDLSAGSGWRTNATSASVGASEEFFQTRSQQDWVQVEPIAGEDALVHHTDKLPPGRVPAPPPLADAPEKVPSSPT
eukprot:Sspe_Gene.9443::Locus_3170_Transcript_1_1_Confidence_1.000_Length_1246::g.9443::m.9443